MKIVTDGTTALIKGNPAVLINDQWIVYQPNARKLFTIPSGRIEDPEITEQIPKIALKDKLSDPENAELMLIVSRDCNLRCKYCFAYGGDIKTKMPTEVGVSAVRHVLRDNSVKKLKLTFSGGEASTNPDIFHACIDEVERRNVEPQYVVATNGVVNTRFLDYLIEKKFIFSISFDGTPQFHDSLRPLRNGDGSAQFVEKTIRKLASVGSTFRTRSTITDTSAEHMPHFVRYFADLGVRFIDFELLDTWGKAGDSNMSLTSIDKFVEYFSMSLDVARELGVTVGTASLVNFLVPSHHMCLGVIGKQFMVLPDGRVTRCNDVMDDSHMLGDSFIVGAYDSNSGRFVIDKPSIVKRLDGFSVDMVPACEKCFIKYLCSGACMTRHMWLTKQKDFHTVSDYQCMVNKRIIELVIRRMWEAVKQEVPHHA